MSFESGSTSFMGSVGQVNQQRFPPQSFDSKSQQQKGNF